MIVQDPNAIPSTNSYSTDKPLELTTTLDIQCDLSVNLLGGVPPHDEPVIIEKEVTANGIYLASDDEADGYSKVTVDVDVPQPVIIEKSVSENGTYNAVDDEADGYSSVTVDVQPDLTTKSITDNGTYNASSDNADGYSQVTVNVQPTLTTKSITENGTYNASSDNADGYSSVTVDIPPVVPTLIEKSITENGTYLASSDNADGYNKVIVDVTSKVTFTPVLIFDEQGIGASSWLATNGTTSLTVNNGNYATGAVVGQYVEASSSNALRFCFPTNTSYRCFGIKCSIDSNFTPRDFTNWYQCSCVLGQELGGEQRDCAIIIDKNGYFALGWATASITSSSVYALDGQPHTLLLLPETGTIKLYIDGVLAVSVNKTMTNNNMDSIGVFWNRTDAVSGVYGKIYSIGCWDYTYPPFDYEMPTLQ